MTTVLVQLGQGAEVGRAQDRCLRALAGREGVQVAAMSLGDRGARRRSRGDRAPARDLSDQPLLRGLRRRRLRRRLQRLPRADPLPGSERVRADAARNRRSGGAGALRGPQRSRGGGRRPGRPAARAPVGGAPRPRSAPGDARPPRRAAAGERGGRRGAVAGGGRRPAPRPGQPVERPAHRTGAGGRRRRASGRAFAAPPPGSRACLGRSPGSARSRSRCRASGPWSWPSASRARSSSGAWAPRSSGTPDPPERVLVVTDSLAIGSLRRRGVAVEHVPAANERQAALAGGDYGPFLRRRLGADPRPAAALPARPRRWRGARRPARGGHCPAPPPR